MKSYLLCKLKSLTKSKHCRCGRCHYTKKHNPNWQAHAAKEPKWHEQRPSKHENKRMKKKLVKLAVESGKSELEGQVMGDQEVGEKTRKRKQQWDAEKERWRREMNRIDQEIKEPEDFAALAEKYATVSTAATSTIPSVGAPIPAAISRPRPLKMLEAQETLQPGKTNLTAALLGVNTAADDGIAVTSTERAIEVLEGRAASRRQRESGNFNRIEED